MKKNIIISVLTFYLFNSCSQYSKENAFNKGETYEYYKDWIKNYKAEGGKLYDSIDYINLKGINEYSLDYLKKGEILYGISKYETSYDIYEIDAREFVLKFNNNKPFIEENRFHLQNNYYINTKIICEDVMSIREITYIHTDYLLKYHYAIVINHEFLSSVEFQYLNGNKKEYDNPNGQTYIESNPFLKENQIDDFFKKNGR